MKRTRLAALALSLAAAAGTAFPSGGAAPKPPATPARATVIRHVRLFDGKNVIPDAGGWVVSTDAIMGGQSTATMEVVDGGANGTPKSLRVHADTRTGAMFPWAGVAASLGSGLMRPVDLSAKKGISFFAKGDTDIRVMLFAASGGRIPRIKAVHAGPGWTEIFLPWSDFGVDGKDVQMLVFTGPETDTADFQLDEVRLK